MTHPIEGADVACGPHGGLAAVSNHAATEVNILFVEDQEDDMKLAVRALVRGGFTPTYRRVQTAAELMAALAQERWAAVVSDFRMPGFTGLQALEIVRASGLDIPFILVSGTIGEDVAVQAMKAGASDYLMKKSLARLAPALVRELKEAQNRAAHAQAQRDLVASEARFRGLTALSSDWYWEQDEHYRFTYISSEPGGRGDGRAWIGKTCWELPFVQADWTSHRTVLAAAKSFVDLQLKVVRPDGATRFIDVSGEPRFDSSGGFIGYRGVGKDNTERATHLEHLQRLRSAMDATSDAIFLMDRSTMQFVYFNDAACRMQECSRNELMAMGPAGALETTVDELAVIYDSIIARGPGTQPRELERRRKDGSRIWVELQSRPHRADAAWMIVTVVRDVTERKLAEIKVGRLNRVHAVLSGINALIVRVRDRAELFQGACQIAVDAGQFRLAWIGVVERSAQVAVPVAKSGADNGYIACLPLGLNEQDTSNYGLVGRAVGQQMSMIVQDIGTDPRIVLRAAAEQRGLRSFAILPLRVASETVGVMALYAPEAGFFDASELALLRDLAGDIAFAMDHLGKSEQLDHLAYYDALTGLPNRTLIHDRLSQILQALKAGPGERGRVAVAVVNMDRFKNVNDTLGRHQGDALLKQVADRLGAAMGTGDRVARLGADQFACVLSHRSEPAEVAHVFDDQIFPPLNQPFSIDGQDLRLTFRVGIALYPGDGADADALLVNAEAASRTAGAAEGRYQFYAPAMNTRVRGKLTLENRLHKALAREEFVLHYQPKVNLQDGSVVGMEALLRWNDPEAGLVSPGEFIPVLEETGMIADVGQWVLNQAIADVARWQAAGLEPPRVAVNVSAIQLRRRSFLGELEKTLSRPASKVMLELELTESMLMGDVEGNVERFQAIRAMGVQLAIDDFGTGYSSLSYLKRFPIDSLKIDKSFVQDITTDADAAAICGAIIDLARNLKLKVIAEGVETEGQLGYLRRRHCDQIQGYLFSRPLPAEGFERMLRERTSLLLPSVEGTRGLC